MGRKASQHHGYQDIQELLFSLTYPPILCYAMSQLCPVLCDLKDCSPPGSSAMGFPRQEYWSGLQCPPPGDFPNVEIKPTSLVSPVLAGRFFITDKAHLRSMQPGKLGGAFLSPPLGCDSFFGQLT